MAESVICHIGDQTADERKRKSGESGQEMAFDGPQIVSVIGFFYLPSIAFLSAASFASKRCACGSPLRASPAV